MTSIHNGVPSVEPGVFERNLDMGNSTSAIEYHTISAWTHHMEQRIGPRLTPFPILAGILPVIFVPSCVADASGKAASIRDILDECGGFPHAGNSPVDFGFIPVPTDELVVVGRICDAARKKIVRELL